MEERNEQEKKMAKLIAKVWSDESFKDRLFADPKAVLAAEGITVPEGADVKVLEQTEKQLYLVIPRRPEAKNSEEADVRKAAIMIGY